MEEVGLAVKNSASIVDGLWGVQGLIKREVLIEESYGTITIFVLNLIIWCSLKNNVAKRIFLYGVVEITGMNGSTITSFVSAKVHLRKQKANPDMEMLLSLDVSLISGLTHGFLVQVVND